MPSPAPLLAAGLGILAAAGALLAGEPGCALAACLPSGVELSTVAEIQRAPVSNASDSPKKVTVEDKLQALSAKCTAEKKLIDARGKEIVFFHLTGCWGHPPPNYQEVLQQQRAALEELKKDHTVIEITCNPSGAAIP